MTTPLTTDLCYMLVEKESAYGTKPVGFPGTSSQYIDFSSETLEDTRENVLSPRLSQPFANWTRVYRAGQYVRGSVVFDVTYRGAELIFEAAWGSRTTHRGTGTTADVFHHVYESAVSLPSLFLELGFGDYALQVHGAMVDSITFAVTADGFIVATVDFVAQYMEKLDIPSEVDVRTPVFRNELATAPHFQPVSLTWYQREPGTYGGFAPALIGFEVAIHNNLRVSHALHSSLIRKPFRGDYKAVTGRLVGEFGDEDLEAFDWYTNAYKALWIQYVTSSTVIPERTAGGNSANYPYEIEFRGNKLDLRGGTPKATGYGRMVLDIPFEGYFDVTSTENPTPVPSINDDPFSFRTTNDLDADLVAA